MWKVIQGLNASPDGNSPNEAMSHNVELSLISNLKLTSSLTTTPASANSICRNTTVTPTDGFKKRIKVPSADDETLCSTSNEQTTICYQEGKGAAGPDNIPHSFPKSLGPLVLQDLLSIFNSSFSLAYCPRIWRVATIIPLLKTGKCPSEVASFRSISLKSCVVKLLEHILADRLNKQHVQLIPS